MKTIEQKQNPIITAIIVSLLLHLLLMLYFVIKQKNAMNPDVLPTNQELLKNKIDTEWAETKQCASSFGAPVFFQNEREKEPARETSTENTQKLIEKEPSPSFDTFLKQKHSGRAVDEDSLSAHPECPDRGVSKGRPKPVEGNDGKVAHFDKLSANGLETKKTPIQKPTPPIKNTPKKPLTLAQLTQGFLNHVKDEGKHAVTMIGKKNRIPSDEQMKYERYLEKLSWCLQNSFSINNDKFPTSYHTETTVNILLAINKDGSIHNLSLAKSSGNVKVDQFALFVFKDASSSFPPVPHYLPHNPFIITYVVGINTQQNNNIHLYRR